jgi:protocatechuate 3,4-dioxygenase beta subunit
MRTHRDGTYRIETVVPGHYLNGDNYRPAHIHVKVRARNRPELTTQLYFEGDPYNAIDPWYRPALLLRPRRSGGVLRANFDFDV